MTTPNETGRIGILISGRGSNMKALVEACEQGKVNAGVAVVISNKEQAPGVNWAKHHGLPVVILSQHDFKSRIDHDRAIVDCLRHYEVDWVCLAGYMRLLSPTFVAAFRQRILNIHPSLLPSFRGLGAQRQALEYGARISGCTVHMVDDELDHGPIVEQQAVKVLEDDDEHTLSARILEQEHRVYAAALSRLLSREWKAEGRRLVWL